MKPEHAKYVLENIKKKPPGDIARELGIRERQVRKFLKKNEEKKREVSAEKVPHAGRPLNIFFALLSIALIIILGFVIYYNSTNGKFIWDDKLLITDNVLIKNWENVSRIFTKDIGSGAGKTYYFYRPIQVITLMMNYSLCGLDVKSYHLTNIILHILVAILIFWFINIIFGDTRLSSLTAVLFIVHPVHTEAVSYISGRADPLGAIFMLLSFIFYLKKFRFEVVGIFLVAATYSLAILSKESSLILLFLILLYSYVFGKKIKVFNFVILSLITIGYLTFRMTVLKASSVYQANNTTLLQRVPGFFVAITNYVRLLLLPLDLHMEYGNMLFSPFDPGAIAGLFIAASLLTYAFWKRRTDGLTFFSITWFFITLLPVSNLYPINFYMTEHWLYLPSIGFFLILSNGLCRMYERTKGLRLIAAGITLGLIAFYSCLTIRQNDYWKEPVGFYERTLKYSPGSTNMLNELAMTYNSSGRREEAIALLKKTIVLNPNYDNAYSNLGIIYNAMGKPREAIEWINKSIKINPRQQEAYNNLGITYDAIGEHDKAISAYKKAIEINPNFPVAYNNLGLTYHNLGKDEEAIGCLKKAIDIDPGYRAEYYDNLGLVYMSLNRNEDAVRIYKKMMENSPGEVSYNHLGIAYSKVGKYEDAIAAFKNAIRINPNNADTYNNLGNVYKSVEKYEDAVSAYEKAIELNPDHAIAHNNLGMVYYHNMKYELAITHLDRAAALGYSVDPGILEFLKQYRK